MEIFCFVMILTSCRTTGTARWPSTPQLKFIILFNEHFPLANFFSKYFVRKNWRGGDELFLKSGDDTDGYAH